MQHSKFIGAFMQSFPHFDTGDVLETGFVDELYIYICYRMFHSTNTVLLNLYEKLAPFMSVLYSTDCFKKEYACLENQSRLLNYYLRDVVSLKLKMRSHFCSCLFQIWSF